MELFAAFVAVDLFVARAPGRRGAPSVVRGPQDSAHMIGVATDIMWRDLALIPRTTMFLEVFSGVSETTALCASTWGMAAYSIEKLRGPAQDVCTAEGLLYAIYLLASLIAGSLCHMSPQCSTWLDMCRHHTCRSREDTEGNLGRKDVAEANHCASFLSSGCYIQTFRIRCITIVRVDAR